MLRKFVEAMRLWCTNFVLIASIILTVWLPGNVLGEYLAWYVPSDDDFVRSCRDGSMIETVFGPIYSGALVYALAQLKEGRRPSYLEAISVGLRTWGRLCSARFFAGLLILFGLILLVVPGIVLMVRYAFIDAVVVLEGAGGDSARRRSAELTCGFRWQIFLAGLLFCVAFVLLVFAIRVPYEQFFPALNTMATDVAADCVLHMVYAVVQIVIFLYYWQATRPEGVEPEPGFTPVEAPGQSYRFREDVKTAY
jgi:hypothetical protein